MYKRYCGQLYVDVLHDYRSIISKRVSKVKVYLDYVDFNSWAIENSSLLLEKMEWKSYFKHFVYIDFFLIKLLRPRGQSLLKGYMF